MQVQNHIMPLTRIEKFFSLLYSNMKAYPKRYGSRNTGEKRYDSDRQWVFFGGKQQMKSVATLGTLYAILSDPNVDTSYYTPNGYYRRDVRWTETLRWLNAYVFDIDEPGLSIQDVFDRIDRAGLPMPSAIVRTPSTGLHITYIFNKPVRATDKAIRLYTAIMMHMAGELGADMAAVGANRIYRTPTEENLIYFEPSNRYDFDVFKDWRDINHPYNQTHEFLNIHIDDLMSHPALKFLLHSTCHTGSRDVVAFNLALAMKASKWPLEQAEAALRNWFHLCCEKGGGAGKKPFTERDAVYKASYVYRNDRLVAPKAEIIRQLTGLPFFYQSRQNWVGAKPRSERQRVHLYEWESDLLTILKEQQILVGTQQELANRLNCPLTSFRAILRRLQSDGKIIVEASRGRGGKTTIRLPEPSNELENPVVEFKRHKRSDSVTRDTNHATIIVHTDFISRNISAVLIVKSPLSADREPPDPGPPD